jgi:hypothetical protein
MHVHFLVVLFFSASRAGCLNQNSSHTSAPTTNNHTFQTVLPRRATLLNNVYHVFESVFSSPEHCGKAQNN